MPFGTQSQLLSSSIHLKLFVTVLRKAFWGTAVIGSSLSLPHLESLTSRVSKSRTKYTKPAVYRTD